MSLVQKIEVISLTKQFFIVIGKKKTKAIILPNSFIT
jgi:hypothetical protein